jgi:hypothetical protein
VSVDGYDATREIRKHPDPAVRNVLVIAMTASAIQGDREKCLEAGMNNYLAKPVRVHTLKTLLETYLSQNPKSMPNLQQEANAMAKDVLEKANVGIGNGGKQEKSEGGGAQSDVKGPTKADGAPREQPPIDPKEAMPRLDAGLKRPAQVEQSRGSSGKSRSFTPGRTSREHA